MYLDQKLGTSSGLPIEFAEHPVRRLRVGEEFLDCFWGELFRFGEEGECSCWGESRVNFALFNLEAHVSLFSQSPQYGGRREETDHAEDEVFDACFVCLADFFAYF